MAQQVQATQAKQATAQQATQNAPQIRVITVAEAVALAYHRRRALAKQGKTTRRVSVPLKPHLLPPDNGEYTTAFGTVKIYSTFLQDQGRWILTVVFPEGFKLQDFGVNIPSPQQ
jgi:hypothetical protein